MSSPGNGITIHSNDCAEYAPPEYSVATVSQTCNNHDKPWDDYPPPPAYDTLTDLPAWCVSPSTPQASTSAINQTHTPTRNIPSTPTTLSAPRAAPQHNSTTAIPQGTSSSVNEQQFQRGKPKAIGIWLIMLAFVHIGVAGGLASSLKYIQDKVVTELMSNGFPFWSTVFYIFTGFMVIAAFAKPTTCLVKSSLFCNIVTVTVACVGLAFAILDLKNLGRLECDSSGDNNFWPPIMCQSYDGSISIMYYVLIATNVLVLILSIFSSCIGCCALCDASQLDPEIFVLQNNVVASRPPQERTFPLPSIAV